MLIGKMAKPEDRDTKSQKCSSVQQCSSRMKEPLKDARDTNGEEKTDNMWDPKVQNSCNKKKRVGRGTRMKQVHREDDVHG